MSAQGLNVPVTEDGNLLSRRFRDDGKPTLRLSETQVSAISDFNNNEDIELQQVACVICGSAQFKKVSEKDRYGFYYPTGVCKSCGNVQQFEYYKPKTVQKFYEKYYRRIYGDATPTQLFNGQYVWQGPKVFEFCKDIVHPGASILEIGCGAGGIIKYFAKRGFDVEGIDLDQQYLEFGRSKGLTLFASDLNGFISSKAYQLVILSHVLEHLTEPQKALEKVRSLLSSDCLLYVEVPSLHSVTKHYDTDLLRYFQNAHVCHFTEATLSNLMSKAGFSPVRKNDFIQALYRPVGTSSVISNQFQASINELTAIEAEYPRWRRRIRSLSRKIIVAAITRLHLKPVVKAVIGHLTSRSNL